MHTQGRFPGWVTYGKRNQVIGLKEEQDPEELTHINNLTPSLPHSYSLGTCPHPFSPGAPCFYLICTNHFSVGSPTCCAVSLTTNFVPPVIVSASVIPFSSRLQSFSTSGSFLMSQLFAADGQSIGASTSASILSMNIQDWFPLGWTGLILKSKGLSRVFSQYHSSKASILWRSAFFMV